jgi:hypothetical protein
MARGTEREKTLDVLAAMADQWKEETARQVLTTASMVMLHLGKTEMEIDIVKVGAELNLYMSELSWDKEKTVMKLVLIRREPEGSSE